MRVTDQEKKRLGISNPYHSLQCVFCTMDGSLALSILILRNVFILVILILKADFTEVLIASFH